MEGARKAFENNAKDPPRENCPSQVQWSSRHVDKKEGSGHLSGVIKKEQWLWKGLQLWAILLEVRGVSSRPSSYKVLFSS